MFGRPIKELWEDVSPDRPAFPRRSAITPINPLGEDETLKTLAKIQARLRSETGATAVEYGLMVALIAVVVIAAVTLLGQNLSALFNNVATLL